MNLQDPVYVAKRASLALSGLVVFVTFFMVGPYMIGVGHMIEALGLPQPWRAILGIAALLPGMLAPIVFGFLGIRLLKASRRLTGT